MVRTGWQRTWVRVLTTALTFIVMAMIFNLSTQTAERSNSTSGFISNAIISVLYPDYPSETAVRRQEIYDGVQHAVRKCAHFSEYTLLGFLLRLCLESWFGHQIRKRYGLTVAAFVIGAAYAGTDEPEALRNQCIPFAPQILRGRLGEGDAQGVADEVVIAGSVHPDGEKTELRRSFLREEIRQAMGVAEHRKDKASVGRNYVVTDASAIEETGLNVRCRPLFRDDGKSFVLQFR